MADVPHSARSATSGSTLVEHSPWLVSFPHSYHPGDQLDATDLPNRLSEPIGQIHHKFHMANPHGVDFAQVIENAEKQGIDLSEIALFYVNLTETEILELKLHGLFVDQTSQRVIGRFNKEGIPLFPDKVKEVYSLSA
jgi:hypothetical protein